MYRVTCLPATLGDTTFKSYWCGGRQWVVGPSAKVADADMTPEMLKELKNDPLGRIVLEHEEDEPKAKAKSDKG